MEIVALKGKEILPYLDEIASLRIAIFREWPYLYEGSLKYEKEYLRMYADSEESLLILSKEKDRVVGAVTGIPLNESMKEIKQAFSEKQISLEKIFYLGEIVLFPEFRKQGTRLKMYQEFESSVIKTGQYEKIMLCEIVRSENEGSMKWSPKLGPPAKLISS